MLISHPRQISLTLPHLLISKPTLLPQSRHHHPSRGRRLFTQSYAVHSFNNKVILYPQSLVGRSGDPLSPYHHRLVHQTHRLAPLQPQRPPVQSPTRTVLLISVKSNLACSSSFSALNSSIAIPLLSCIAFSLQNTAYPNLLPKPPWPIPLLRTRLAYLDPGIFIGNGHQKCFVFCSFVRFAAKS